MNIKAIIKNSIGEKGFEQLSLLKSSLDVSRNRLWRGLSRSEKAHPGPEINRYGISAAHTFFGYYDITPFSADNTRILAMATSSSDHDASARQDTQIGYFYLHDGKRFVVVGQTPTWCWQMGCRLQWYPEDPNRLILYNTMVNSSYGSVVQDISTRKIESQFGCPIYVIDQSGRRGLSLNFSRLHRLRPGYGYRNLPDDTEGRKAPEDDGIRRFDLTNGQSEVILDLKRLATFEPLPSMENAEHYVNHLSFNPSGARFMFFHLWVVNGQRYNRLITSDLAGEDLYILESEGTVSHYTWKSETELLATVNYGKKGTHYNLYSDKSTLKTMIASNLLNRDGHPSYSPNGDRLLTDTYPDKYGEQNLLLLTSENKLQNLASLYSPPRFRGETRCDLHPRWDREGELICVDETTKGLRKLGVLRVELS